MRHEPNITAAMPARQRHYGMDWLRIGAFALLILYHIGMVFAPWGWVVKSATTYPALIAPMAFLTPWRLALLFAVSGYASAKLFVRTPDVTVFLRSRSARLLVPLAFGMAVFVPVEMWVRVRGGGYAPGYLHFWAVDYWRVGAFHGVGFPSWEHLWFVAYLWAYTLGLGAVLALGWRAAPLAAWLAEGRRLLWAPIVALATVKLALMFVVAERQGLFSDWAGHAEYAPMFGLGFVLAGHRTLWPPLASVFVPAIATALLAGMVVVGIEVRYPGEALPPHALMALDRAARIAMAWSMICVLFQAADRWLNRDHAWRGPLARAVFPAYILHHTALIVAAWWTLPMGFALLAEFAILAVASLAACFAGYAIGSRVGWIGTVIGMPPR
ncbi:acyltransferase family protein [Sphingomonas donggukensis]|uniref:Acyltransferase family protein n=1 Tax=Sphingomonas donggukensis TaxID=2949093 RepID=A0ABY4TRP3_9SPHN|nr:acyltransferase family protein [Sphingomonas donggukensis]URW74619.1 acyltransferase family protein [Sphingomonas donggukensis]